MALYAVCSDNIVLLLDASAAMPTSPKFGRSYAWSPGQAARRGGESRGHSAGPTAPRRFEHGQTARRRGRQRFFWPRHLLQVSCAYDGEQRIRPHCQGNVAIPARPTPDLIVI